MKILIVDDNQTALSLIKTLLTSENHDVMVTTKSRMGIEYANEFKFDCIIMDLLLDELNGIDATIEIRSNETFHNKIIAFTANKEMLEYTDKNIFDYTLIKPDIEGLLELINRLN
jgi:CheY-like chemotaxis protein